MYTKSNQFLPSLLLLRSKLTVLTGNSAITLYLTFFLSPSLLTIFCRLAFLQSSVAQKPHGILCSKPSVLLRLIQSKCHGIFNCLHDLPFHCLASIVNLNYNSFSLSCQTTFTISLDIPGSPCSTAFALLFPVPGILFPYIPYLYGTFLLYIFTQRSPSW